MPLFRIEEDDLAELEKMLPQFCDALFLNMTPKLRIKLRRAQQIVSNVRWGYGPPSHVERVELPGDDQGQ